MASNSRTIEWQKNHPHRMRTYKIKYYFSHRKILNGMISKAKGIEEDEIDIWYKKNNPNG